MTDRRFGLAPSFYLGLLALAELAVAYGPHGLGVLCMAGLLMAMQLHATFSDDRQFARLLAVLALVPLVRLLALSLTVLGLPPLLWYGAVAVGLLLAAIWGWRDLGLSARALGLRPGRPLAQAGIALLGLPLGLLEYTLVQPEPLVHGLGWGLALGLLVLLSAGIAEELLFRGVLQQAARRSLGRTGIIFAAAVFAVLHLGSGSPLSMLFAFGVGLLFGRLVERTGSLLGVIVANTLAACLTFLVLPLAWQSTAPLLDLRQMLGSLAQGGLIILAALLAVRWLYSLWRSGRGRVEASTLRFWAGEVSRLAAGSHEADLDRAARALCARLGPLHVLVVELDAARARTVVRVSYGASGRRLRGPEGLEAPWAAFARLIDIEARGPQQVPHHPFSLSEGPFLVMPIGTPGRWAVVRPRPGREEETRRRLAALVETSA